VLNDTYAVVPDDVGVADATVSVFPPVVYPVLTFDTSFVGVPYAVVVASRVVELVYKAILKVSGVPPPALLNT